MKKDNKLSIGVCGLWRLGLVTSVCLAKLGYRVYGYDSNKKNIGQLNSAHPPLFEPNLKHLIKKYLNKSLFFSSDPNFVLQNKDYHFITLDLDVNKNFEVDIKPLEKIFDLVVSNCSKKTTIIISSQLPVGTTRNLINRLPFKNKVVYFPENLRLGTAIENFLNPSAIVLGADKKSTIGKFIKDFPQYKGKIIKMSVEGAEVLKLALNSYLALNISFSSELSDLCERIGVGASEIISGLKSDPRISSKAPLNVGLGFSGITLSRDVKSLIQLSKSVNYPAKLLNAIFQVNQDRLNYLLIKIKRIIPNLKNKRVGILGLSYKPNTSSTKGSQALILSGLLFKEGVEVRGFDPVIKNLNLNFIKVFPSFEKFVKDLDLIILMTEWPEFKKINPEDFSELMREKIVIDTKNFLERQEYLKKGFRYFGIGENV